MSNPPQSQELGPVSHTFSFLERHASMPYILSRWLQLSVSMVLNSICFFVLYLAISGLRSDLDRAVEEASAETLAEMAACKDRFLLNRCGAADRAPALEEVCNNWALCMSRDPDHVKRSHLSASLFAEILNGFVDHLSWKAMVSLMRLGHSTAPLYLT